MFKATSVKLLIEAQQSNAVNYLVEAVSNEEDSALFNGQTLSNLNADEVMSYYFAILTAYSVGDTGSEKSQRRRKTAFDRLLSLLKKGRLSDLNGRQLLDKLFGQLRLLKESQANALAEKIMDDFKPTGTLELAGHAKALELLGQLVSRAGLDRRHFLIQRLCESDWQSTAVVMLTSSLVEIVESELECETALRKISPYAVWKGFDQDEESDMCVDIEELPALLYQLTGLTRKCDGTSARVKSLVLETVASSIDSLLWAGSTTRTIAAYSNTSVESSSCLTQSLSDSQKTRFDAVMATIIHHLSMLVAKDQGFSSEIANVIKSRRLIDSQQPDRSNHAAGNRNSGAAAASSSSSLSTTKESASPSRLLLALLAARAPRQVVISLGQFLYIVSCVNLSIHCWQTLT